MAIKINAQVTGYGPQPANTQALVIVTVEFDGPSTIGRRSRSWHRTMAMRV
jgi:hypothetical protein